MRPVITRPANPPLSWPVFVCLPGRRWIVLPIENNRSELIEAWHSAALSYSQRKDDGLPIDGTRSYLDLLLDEYLETVRGA